MLKQRISQKQTQKLSPQQIQLMKLLQIPTATLDQRIQEELEANPALEEQGDELANEDKYEEQGATEEQQDEEYDDELSLDDYDDYLDDDTASYKYKSNNYSADDEDKSIPISVEKSFHEYLEQQLGMLKLNEQEYEVAQQLIGNVDDDGYLRREPIAIVDDLAFTQNIQTTEEEVRKLLKKIQQLDPPGVAARDLRECLLIQLDRKLNGENIDAAYEERRIENMEFARTLIEEHFEEFSKKHYNRLIKQLGVDRERLREIHGEILKLNPKPGSGYAPSPKFSKHYIVPDFIIEYRMGELDLRLNSRNAPELRINDHYKDMLKAYKVDKTNKKQRDAAQFIKQKIDSAKWFIDAIRQRQATMLKTMHTIMQLQYDYFLTGDKKKLRPMILKDVAEITGLDISTVSRVANSKYVQTEFGTMRLKDFFSESLQKKSGDEVSTLEVKQILKELIEEENKRKPMSDEKLKNALRDRGYKIARRTVAKYREQLDIPVARLRKEL